MQDKNSSPMRIGIVMAGAVSAGAYQGGVMDYFFEILNAWQKAKDDHIPGVPIHNVSIDVIGGASAGGMTAGMVTASLQQDLLPVTQDKRNDEEYKKKNILYNAWVNLTSDDMLSELFDDSDIRKEGKVISALNSNFIEEITNREIKNGKFPNKVFPKYINPRMQILLTLSNLVGYEYKLFFTSYTESFHAMTQFKDIASFRLGKEYTIKDGRIPLDLANGIGCEELCQAAPATGAFPVGLAYRKFTRKRKYIEDNDDILFLKKVSSLGEANSESQFTYEVTCIKEKGKQYQPEELLTTYHVDGGMLNNQPFDLVKQAMDKIGTSVKDETEFNSTVIMIDPFPAVESVIQKGKTKMTNGSDGDQYCNKDKGIFPFDLLGAIARTFHAMRGQLLFKGDDIIAMFNKKDFSRFMISPSGPKAGKGVYDGSKAIACGCLDGFGGFIDKSFREHDFYLGRANAQNFFRKYFAVRLGDDGLPVNPTIAIGYDRLSIDRFKFQDKDELKEFGENAPWYIPIIPDINEKGEKKVDEIIPPFPSYDMVKFDGYQGVINQRINTIGNLMFSGWLKFFFKVFFFLKRRFLYNQIRTIVYNSLKQWRLTN